MRKKKLQNYTQYFEEAFLWRRIWLSASSCEPSPIRNTSTTEERPACAVIIWLENSRSELSLLDHNSTFQLSRFLVSPELLGENFKERIVYREKTWESKEDSQISRLLADGSTTLESRHLYISFAFCFPMVNGYMAQQACIVCHLMQRQRNPSSYKHGRS